MATEQELARLREPFPTDDIEWRLQQAGEKNGRIWGKALAYVTNRAIQQRLDDVVGPANWKNEFREGPGGGVLCGISVRVTREDGSHEWVTKWDGAENTDVEAVKGGLSAAMKRSASTGWGIGRYLYNLEEGWINVNDGGRLSGKTKDGKWFRWDPPTLPDFAIPRERQASAEQLARVDALLEHVRDEKVAANVRKRVADGLSATAADEAIRFLESRSGPRAA
jgi:hypothetical protein